MSVQKLRARSDVLHMSFNQDASCLSCGLVDGFRVFTCEDYKEDQSIGENVCSLSMVYYYLSPQ